VLALLGAYLSRNRVGHPVTAPMRASAQAASGRVLRARPGLDWRRPTVLYFIQNGCPCSELAHPFFERLASLARNHGTFAGVVGGTLEDAQAWQKSYPSSFPTYSDAKVQLIEEFGIERSAFVALVLPGGVVRKVWPGFSGPMLLELLRELSPDPDQLADLDVKAAPSELTSGCSF